MRRAGPGLGPEYVGPGRASGLSTSGRAGPRAWVEDFGPGSGLEFRPVATSTTLKWLQYSKTRKIEMQLTNATDTGYVIKYVSSFSH